ncbi:hypothetical protein Afil01_23770 [Actinorhabdospora filicis]|uniref:Uncharacterized protein n=1 Tax=Actinorhabdospora filicis TaxID=1785913 RepID=A0A9W6WAE8_9ACTN|nr:hypothetical protein [Actinorhabdospora filicis]GLZ77570.1 hypothetical protein Afil01_23770 [Actinorhabdospora filicis]
MSTDTAADETAVPEEEPAPPSPEPEKSDVDPWERFAATAHEDEDDGELPRRGRVGLIAAHASRVVRHEWTLAAVASLLLAVVMSWPLWTDPVHRVPHDTGDPLVSAYLIGWTGHATLTDPLGVFSLNSFFGSRLSLFFGDSLLGFAPAGLIGSGPQAAILRYNILYTLCVALTVFGGYALLRQLGSRVPGAAFGAVAIAFAPWRLAQAGHIQVIAVGGILLSLAMLARGHGWSLRHGYRPRRTRWGWIAAGWAVATWQITIGFGMGVAFGYLLAGIVVVAAIGWLFKRPRVPGEVLITDAAGAAVFAVVAIVLSIPYFQVAAAYPYAADNADAAERFSPPWLGLITAPGESWLWGRLHTPARDSMYLPGETTLLIGFALLGLALAGFLYSSWTRRQRWFLALGLAVAVVLTMGANFLDDGAWGYMALHEYLPGWAAMKVPGRLILYVTVIAAILAAGTITRLGDRLHEMAVERRVDPREPVRRPPLARVALLIPVALVLLEGVSVAAYPTVPAPPAALSEVDGPMLVLPAGKAEDARLMLWSTDGFPELVNGAATFVPEEQDRMLAAAVSFPNGGAVNYLRAMGVKTVVVRKDRIAGTSWQHVLDFPPTDANVVIEDKGDVVVFKL